MRENTAQMGFEVKGVGVADGDLQLTAERAETKYLVTPEHAALLEREIAVVLPAHHFRGLGAANSPHDLEYATTVYFDTAERDLYREALDSAVHLKLRAREYYRVSSPFTREHDHAQCTPLSWLEIKHRDGARTRKRRLGIARRELARFFAAGPVSAESIERAAAERAIESAAADVLAEVASICRRYPSPLHADCLVNYRRSAWQDAVGSLRVTIDREVSFFAPQVDPFARDACLARETLGQPDGHLDSAVVEIKSRGPVPEWLERMLSRHGLVPERFSKFVAASRAVHD